MKELKFKSLWVVTVDDIQWGAFRYFKEAQAFAVLIGGKVDGKRNLLTDKY
jgi:hypothetical protein